MKKNDASTINSGTHLAAAAAPRDLAVFLRKAGLRLVRISARTSAIFLKSFFLGLEEWAARLGIERAIAEATSRLPLIFRLPNRYLGAREHWLLKKQSDALTAAAMEQSLVRH